jgi:hypothetical protein
MSRVFPVEAMEEELYVGAADGDGAVAGGVLDVGVVYLEVEGAGASPRGGGADWRRPCGSATCRIISSSP